MIGFISTVMPRKERVLKQKKTALKRAAEDQGQTKLTLFCGKEKTLSYQHSWLEERSWHVYSPELSGGLCKMCVLFDRPHKKTQRGAFVATAFQKVQRSELIKAHAETDYHKAAVAQGSEFMRTFMHPESSVEADKSSAQYYQRNKHVLGGIVDAVLLCAKQGLPLRGHRDTKVNDVYGGPGLPGIILLFYI